MNTKVTIAANGVTLVECVVSSSGVVSPTSTTTQAPIKVASTTLPPSTLPPTTTLAPTTTATPASPWKWAIYGQYQLASDCSYSIPSGSNSITFKASNIDNCQTTCLNFASFCFYFTFSGTLSQEHR